MLALLNRFFGHTQTDTPSDNHLKRKHDDVSLGEYDSSSDEETSTKQKRDENPSVLFITTHSRYGDIPVEYISPINIEKINAVTLGVCNYLTSDFARDMANEIISEIKKGNVSNMKKGSRKIRDILKRSDTEIEFVKSHPEKTLDDEDRAYIYTTKAGKGYQIHSISIGETVLDKEYAIMPIDRLNTNTPFFNTATLLTDGSYDLIQRIRGRSSRGGAQIVRLSEILQYLKKKSIENLIIVDLTCASTPGQTRGFRAMERQGIGYKKIKLSKKHKKHKRSNKPNKTKKLKSNKRKVHKTKRSRK